MNERIKLLAEQAKIDYDLRPEIARAPVWIGTDEELAKFAELIVRECADWIKNTDSDPDIGEEDAKALLEHFGVEL
jgi:precorrin-6B methylase 1